MILFDEKLLQFIWNQQLFDHTGLRCVDGRRLLILDQGKLNDGNGPDFMEARIFIDKTVFHGSVEIHVMENNWYTHGHHIDTHYNSVVLHVCYGSGVRAKRKDGSVIPTLLLKPLLSSSLLLRYDLIRRTMSPIPCSALLSQYKMSNAPVDLVAERLLLRSAKLKVKWQEIGFSWHQLAIQEILKALGAPYHTQNMQDLGSVLSYKVLHRYSSSLFQLEAILFGQAGLLQGGRNCSYYTKLKTEFEFLMTLHDLRIVHVLYRRGGMRPSYQIHLRLAQFASLLHHNPNLINEVLKSNIPTEDQFQFPVSEYWRTHLRFEWPSKPSKRMISAQMRAGILLNGLLPLLFFYGSFMNDNSLMDKTISTMKTLPAENNRIVRKFKDLGLVVHNAADSQALLQLYKTYCNFRRCLECKIGQSLISRHESK